MYVCVCKYVCVCTLPRSLVALPALRMFSRPSSATVTTFMSVTCSRPHSGGIVPS